MLDVPVLAGRREGQVNPPFHSKRREVMTSDSFGSHEVTDPMLPRKSSCRVVEVTVPQTDSGRRVEYTKALERTVVKELCKLTP